MEFKQLQSFVEIVKQHSFTKAASTLYLSQPTISSHIKQLEDELKTRLIIRTTKSFELTLKGEQFYQYALSILELRDRMIADCSVHNQTIIQVGASTIPSAYILPDILSDFGKLHPDYYFIIQQNDSQGIIDKVKDGILDIGLIGMNVDDEALSCIPFCKDHLVLITPVNNYYLNLKNQPDIDFKELLKNPIILREKGSGTKKNVDYFLDHLGIKEEQLSISARVNDQEAIKNLVASGLGLSILSERAAQNFLDEKRLIGFPLPNDEFSRNLYVIYRNQYVQKSSVKKLTDFILHREY